MKAKIIGTGSYLPEQVLTNVQLSTMMDTSDEWITTRTGIKERRISSGENNWEMAFTASKRAIENANIKPEELDYIVCSVVTPDYFFPAMSSILQGKLEAVNARAIDMNVGCSGFVYALDVANGFIKLGKAKKVLVVASECFSRIVDYSDRSTSILFGDGAGACILSATDDNDESGIIDCIEKCDGTGAEHIMCRALKQKTRFTLKKSKILGNNLVDGETLSMDGQSVFKFAVSIVPKITEEILQKNNLTIEDLDYFIPHQANMRIIQSAAKKMGLSLDKIIVNIQKYGNMSSACLPICLDEFNRNGLAKKGDNVVLCGFGAGFAAGAILIRW